MRRRFMSGNGIPDNQIWYTSNDGNIIDVYTKPSTGTVTPDYGLGSVIISNQYYDKGIIKTAGYVTQIGVNAFSDKTSLLSITLPSQVAVIYYGAFQGCTSLTSVTIPDSVTSIGYPAFRDCSSLQEFKGKFASEDGRCLIIDGVLNSFAPAGLTEYSISDSVTSIGNSAFRDLSSLTSVTISDSVTSIGNRAFDGCTSLESVTIGNGVTSIGEEAFFKCTLLKSVYCKATTPPTGGVSMFSYLAGVYLRPIGCTIYVPRNSVNAYKSATYWSNYASYIVGYDF